MYYESKEKSNPRTLRMTSDKSKDIIIDSRVSEAANKIQEIRKQMVNHPR